MNISHTEHIEIGTESSGEIYIDIDDWELFDYIDDYLSDEFDIQYENYQNLVKDKKTVYRMTIGNSYSFDGIKNLVLKLPTDEIERI